MLPLPPELIERGRCPFDPPAALDRMQAQAPVGEVTMLTLYRLYQSPTPAPLITVVAFARTVRAKCFCCRKCMWQQILLARSGPVQT